MGGFGTKPLTTAPPPPSSGFSGFKLGQTDSTTPAQPKDQPAQSSTTGGFGAKLGAGLGASGTSGFSLGLTPGTSTAATSVSGDSTSTTPAPVKKDFAGFSGITPSGTPAPGEGEKKDEKNKFGFGPAAATTTEKDGEKSAFPSFGGLGQKKDDAKTDDAAKKEEEKPKTFGGFGAPGTSLPVIDLTSS
jgi:hypothetical protein